MEKSIRKAIPVEHVVDVTNTCRVCGLDFEDNHIVIDDNGAICLDCRDNEILDQQQVFAGDEKNMNKETRIKQCSGCGEEYELGTNCKCGYLSISDDAISVEEFGVLRCLDYHATSSDGKASGFVCNNSNHEHCGKIVVVTGVFKE